MSRTEGALEFIEFDDGLNQNIEFSELVTDQVARWVQIQRVIELLPDSAHYRVQFRKRNEIFDLIECQIAIALGPKNWAGRALGITPARAFGSAFSFVESV